MVHVMGLYKTSAPRDKMFDDYAILEDYPKIFH